MAERKLLMLYVLIGISLICWCCFVGCTSSLCKKGETCIEVGDYSRAIVFFERAIENNPSSCRARRGLALALLKKYRSLTNQSILTSNTWREVVENISSALSVCSDTVLKHELPGAYSQLSRTLASERDTLNALVAIRQSLRLGNVTGPTCNYGAALFYSSSLKDSAYLLLQKALQLNDADATTLFNVGMYHWKEKDTLQAWQWWYKGVQANPADENLHYWLAQASPVKEAVK